MNHKLIYQREDGTVVEWDLSAMEDAAYDKGFEAGKRKIENATGITESLTQVDRMARQIEEAHAALRRRNTEIRQMSARIAELQSKIEAVKNQTEREARAEAWHEGWKHDAEFQSMYGQFCRDCNCNPYKKDTK